MKDRSTRTTAGAQRDVDRKEKKGQSYERAERRESDDRFRNGARVLRMLPDDAEVEHLLAASSEDMTLKEAALYIAGYTAGYAAAEENP
jgi:hypothetical protein